MWILLNRQVVHSFPGAGSYLPREPILPIWGAYFIEYLPADALTLSEVQLEYQDRWKTLRVHIDGCYLPINLTIGGYTPNPSTLPSTGCTLGDSTAW